MTNGQKVTTFVLVEDETHKPIHSGQKVKTFRGEVVTFESAQPLSGPLGKVHCRNANGQLCEWYPSVIGAVFVQE
jgi:hypothetical protein